MEEEGFLLHLPPRNSRLTGMLLLRGFGEKWSQFLTLLSMEKPRFQRARLIECEFNTSIPTQTLLDAVSRNIRTLHLIGFGRRECCS